MADLKSAYVIAAWGGPRRVKDRIYDNDRSVYLKHHLACLRRLKHQLDLIIVAVPYSDEQDERFLEYLRKGIPKEVPRGDGGVTPVEVYRRNNNAGLAFGSFSDSYFQFRDKGIHWWYWFEDDFVPLCDNFDSRMKGIWDQSPDISFLAARVNWGDTRRMPHAIISIGMTTTEKIEAVRKLHGQLDYLREDTADYRPHECYMSQRKFTNAFTNVGGLYDVMDHYRVGLRMKSGTLRWYGKSNKRDLLGPIQFLPLWRGVARYPTPEAYR